MSGQVRRSVVHPTSLPFEAPVIARILLIILAELTLTVSARLRYLGNAGQDRWQFRGPNLWEKASVGRSPPKGTVKGDDQEPPHPLAQVGQGRRIVAEQNRHSTHDERERLSELAFAGDGLGLAEAFEVAIGQPGT